MTMPDFDSRTGKGLIAWHGDPELRAKALATMARHRLAKTLVQEYGYWRDGKGCAVGCLLESDDHSLFETRYGIPCLLARLEDRIFENLQVATAREWPERFLSAIQPGMDLSAVWPRFAVRLMVDPVIGVLQFAKTGQAQSAIRLVAGLYAGGWPSRHAAAANGYDATYTAYAAASAAAGANAIDNGAFVASAVASAVKTTKAKTMALLADALIEEIERCEMAEAA